jgi:hypothetical protein
MIPELEGRYISLGGFYLNSIYFDLTVEGVQKRSTYNVLV